jgi:hypothetical protein
MFLNDPAVLPALISRAQFSIISHSPSFDPKSLDLKAAYSISPDEKNVIRLEALAPLRELTRTKNSQKVLYIIFSAETLTEAAENALLKLLEQPGPNLSFTFFTTNPEKLLPTIKSRAHIYFLKSTTQTPPDPKLLPLARELVSGNLPTLLRLSTALAKDRAKALAVVETAIRELTSAQTKSPTETYLKRLEKLLTLHENLSNNGHIRLHIIADML